MARNELERAQWGMKHGAARDGGAARHGMGCAVGKTVAASTRRNSTQWASTRVGAIFERDGEMQGGSRPRKWRPDGRTPTPMYLI
jgi:hypothetical protein